MQTELRLIRMSDVQEAEVRWLWRPYIPSGKITIVQGDPGDGKTTFALDLAARLTRGDPMPEETVSSPPSPVIYQTAEDGLADTIKPRLMKAGADCSRVLVIDESQQELTLLDKRLEQAIVETGAKLAVLDPLQAYLGGEIDMHRANEVRPVFKQLAVVAEKTDCAILLIGHMNKAQGMKASYRGLGSIDLRAAARSVLVVGRDKEDPAVRIVAHDKSSLSPEGKSIAFRLDPDAGVHWLGFRDVTVDELLSGKGPPLTKTARAEELLREMLEREPVPSQRLASRAEELGISQRTLKIAKSNLGVRSCRRGDKWYARLPERQGGKEVKS